MAHPITSDYFPDFLLAGDLANLVQRVVEFLDRRMEEREKAIWRLAFALLDEYHTTLSPHIIHNGFRCWRREQGSFVSCIRSLKVLPCCQSLTVSIHPITASSRPDVLSATVSAVYQACIHPSSHTDAAVFLSLQLLKKAAVRFISGPSLLSSCRSAKQREARSYERFDDMTHCKRWVEQDTLKRS